MVTTRREGPAYRRNEECHTPVIGRVSGSAMGSLQHVAVHYAF